MLNRLYPRAVGSDKTTLYLPFNNSGLSNLEQDLTINGTTVSPTFVYEGKNATAASWAASVGSDLTATGSGNTLGLGTPFLDNTDEAVGYVSSMHYYAPTLTYAQPGTNDFVFEVVFRAGAVSDTGYLLRTISGTGFYLAQTSGILLLSVVGAGGSTTAGTPALTPGAWYHVIGFVDASGGIKMYANAVAGATTGDMTSVGSVENGYALKVGYLHENPLAYAAMWIAPDWLDTHLQADIAKERFAKLCGVYPSKAKGTAVPEVMTRSSVAHLDKFEDDGTRKLYMVGANWPRLCLRQGADGNGLKGYLSEGAATNLEDQSEDFDSAYHWMQGLSVVTGVTSPRNDSTASFLHEDTATSNHRIKAVYLANTSGVNYTVSIFVKAENRANIQISSDNGSVTEYIKFDLLNGLVHAQSGMVDYDIEDLDGEWFRVQFTYTAGTTWPSVGWYVYLADADWNTTFTGLDQDSIAIWGAQGVVGNYAGSYIKTDGSTETRGADELYYKGDDGNVAPLGQCMIHAQTLLPDYDATTDTFILEVNDGGSSADRLAVYHGSAEAPYGVTSASGGNAGATGGTPDIVDNEVHSVILRAKENSLKIAVDGTNQGTEDTECDMPNDLDRICIGMDGSSSKQCNGLVANFVIKPSVKGRTPASLIVDIPDV